MEFREHKSFLIGCKEIKKKFTNTGKQTCPLLWIETLSSNPACYTNILGHVTQNKAAKACPLHFIQIHRELSFNEGEKIFFSGGLVNFQALPLECTLSNIYINNNYINNNLSTQN